jgi:hypothetical protein
MPCWQSKRMTQIAGETLRGALEKASSCIKKLRLTHDNCFARITSRHCSGKSPPTLAS